MRAFVLALLLTASPITAQTTSATAPPNSPPTAGWNPAAPYIAPGQDEPGYRSWYLADPSRAVLVKSFNDYLATGQVAGVLPTWQLLRTATSWKDCGAQPFEVPPTEQWPHLVQTLRYIHDYVVPAVGPVEPVSAYRNPSLNVCAGGAPESAHKLGSALDLVPLNPIDRITLMRKLCSGHSEHGAAYNIGLGFYAFLRFHVDSIKYRRWNMDPAVAAECPPLLKPEDAGSVGQPLPPAPDATANRAPNAAPAPASTSPAVQPQPGSTKP